MNDIGKKVAKKFKNFFFDEEHEENRKLIKESFIEKYDRDFIASILDLPIYKSDTIIGKDVLSDIEMFSTYQNTSESSSVIDVVDNTLLKGSRLFLDTIIQNPETDIDLLTKRQMIVKNMSENNDIYRQLWERLKENEDDIIWLFKDKDENMQALFDMLYFRSCFLKKLNNSEYVLTGYNIYRIILSPVIGIISPIIYFIIPYLILNFKFKLKISFKTYLQILFKSSNVMFSMNGWSSNMQFVSYIFSMVFYFQGVFQSIEISKTLYNISDFITKRMESVMQFIEDSNEIVTKLYNATPYCIETVFLKSQFTRNIEAKDIIAKLKRKRWWITQNFGHFLRYFKNIDKLGIKNILSKVYVLDTVRSISLLQDKNYCFSKYIESKSPYLNIVGLMHPSLQDNYVSNDITIGRDDFKNMIITGPNAGGKSTLVKSMLINVILSQTIGMSCCKVCEVTPFTFINSQINIPDCKGKESLFQAEMNRCKYNFDEIENLTNGKHSLILLDEIFNSTNPVEGIAGAYAVANHLGKYSNVMIVLTTHYIYLTKLEKNTNKYTNYKMNVKQTNDKIEFIYKLKKGVSKQYIALDLLEQKGFKKELIEEAKVIKNKLCV
jgi:DNA mismatch repair protein MutS